MQCPECRNTIDIGNAKTNEIVECNFCGITLQNTPTGLEVVDEGK